MTLFLLLIVVVILISIRKYIEKKVPGLPKGWSADTLKEIDPTYSKLFRNVGIFLAFLTFIAFLLIFVRQ